MLSQFLFEKTYKMDLVTFAAFPFSQYIYIYILYFRKFSFLNNLYKSEKFLKLSSSLHITLTT